MIQHQHRLPIMVAVMLFGFVGLVGLMTLAVLGLIRVVLG